MGTKGVLGNDPFQRGAAQRPSPSKPAKPAEPAESPKPGAKAAAPPAAEKPKKATRPPQGKAPARKKAAAPAARQAPKPSQPARASRKGARKGAKEKEQKPLLEQPLSLREPAAPAVPPAYAEAAGGPVRQESAEEALPEAAPAAPASAEPPAAPAPAAPAPTWRLREEGLGEPPEAEVVEQEPAVQEPRPRWEEIAPSRQVEGEVISVTEVAVQVALAPTSTAGGPEEAERAEPPGSNLSQRVRSLLGLVQQVTGQALGAPVLRRSLGVAQGVVGALRAGVGLGASTSLDEYGRDAALVHELEPVLEFLYERYWRVSVQGAELVPEGASLLVANHSGALPFDGPVLQRAVAHERPELAEARWLVEDQIFYSPVLGTLINRLGAVRACPENALRLLDEQRPLIVFPEGFQGLSKPFAQRYQLKRFGRGGFVKLALRTGAPIVPVAIVGAEESSPLLAKLPSGLFGLPYLPLTPLGPLPLPARWSIRFGEPITLEGLPPEAAEDTVQVQRLTERTREAIQSMLQSLLEQRRSIFTG